MQRAIAWFGDHQKALPPTLTCFGVGYHTGSYQAIANDIDRYLANPSNILLAGYILRSLTNLKLALEPPPIEVVRLKEHPNAIAIDRSSVFGNPFHMRSEGDRDLVCDLFERYFQLVLKGQDPYETAIAIAPKKSLISKTWQRPTWLAFNRAWVDLKQYSRRYPVKLGCHCAPNRCHGHTIQAFLERDRLKLFNSKNS